jgi:dienelactone hydrolase
LGDSPAVVAEDLSPGAEYTLDVELTDALGRVWQTSAEFRADDSGRIDLARDAPVAGPYHTPDPFGLLSAMRMPVPTPEDWQSPTPRNFNEIVFALKREGAEVASTTTRQWIFPPGVESEPIGGGVVAEIFYTTGATNAPGTMLLGGSGGGMGWSRRTAALLAEQGFVAMAVSYFNDRDLPDHLVEIPLEYVEAALDSLKSRPEVDSASISLVGYSKGAELSLLVASRRPDIGSVVAFAPGSAVFQGFRPPDYPVISSWSARGVGLPFVPNAYDEKFFDTFDGMYLWYRTLGQHDAFAEAAIPVEKIQGDLLLISGADDQIWPATLMGEQIIARLRVNDFAYKVKHLAFPNAGHGIAAPPGEPLTSVSDRLGGTPAGNGMARLEGWRAMLEFLGREVDEPEQD